MYRDGADKCCENSKTFLNYFFCCCLWSSLSDCGKVTSPTDMSVASYSRDQAGGTQLVRSRNNDGKYFII